MDLPTGTLVDALAEKAGLGAVRALSPLPGGSNNRVFRVEGAGGEALLKEYHRSPDDPRDRLASEFGFCEYAWKAGVRAAPKPLAKDAERGLALYEYVHGRKLSADEATEAKVDEALDFFESLNRERGGAAGLPSASEAAFSTAEHVTVVAKRIERLAQSEGAARAFVRGPLTKAWAGAAKQALRSGQPPVPQQDRRVSPSDFGFHNALLEESGRLRFIDFEYAGWDDPAKTACDFFCQPAVPAPPSSFDRFVERLARGLSDPKGFRERAKVLRPVYQLKWCCIMLNDFLPAGARRRAFAGAEPTETVLAAQLEKAKNALAKVSL
jgi:hypothetical protein